MSDNANPVAQKRQENPVSEMTCFRGHFLKLLTCKSQTCPKELYHCDACNFELCVECLNTKLKVTCPRGHIILRFSSDKEKYICDICNAAQELECELYGCRKCDYDICAICYQRERKRYYEKITGSVQMDDSTPDEKSLMNEQYSQSEAHTQIQDEHKNINPLSRSHSEEQAAFFSATDSGDKERIRSLISQNVDVNQTTDENKTALFFAAFKGHHECVQLLLEANSDVNHTSDNGWTALFYAALRGKIKCTKLLLSKNADVNHKGILGTTPLFEAVEQGHLLCSLALISAGADINAQREDGQSLLVPAAQLGLLEILRLLISEGANMNLSNHEGWVPLHFATLGGFTDCVQLLLKEKAMPDYQTKAMNTALSIAAREGHLECVRSLVKADSDVNIASNIEWTSIFYAAQEGRTKCIELLVSHKAHVNHHSKDGSSPLSLASMNGHMESVKSLVSLDADVNSSSNDGSTALHEAVRNEKLQILDILCSSGADMTALDKNSKTPISVAIELRKIEYVTFFVRHDADIWKTSKNETSIWDFAVECYNEKKPHLLEEIKKSFTYTEAKFIKFGELRNVKKLSSGNFGITYKSDLIVDNVDGEDVIVPVVCKTSKQETGSDEWYELQALRNLPRNPHVLCLLGICTDFPSDPDEAIPAESSKPETAMIVPFKFGGSLRDYLDSRSAPLSLKRMIEFGIDMARGLEHLHNNEYKHCDVAARNFLLRECDNGDEIEKYDSFQCVILSDFGLTRSLKHEDKQSSVPWRWASYETLSSRGAITNVQTDIWMIGVALWELTCVNCTPPYTHLRNSGQLLETIQSQNKAPFIFARHIRPEWKKVVELCCSVDPSKRPSATELIEELKNLLEIFDEETVSTFQYAGVGECEAKNERVPVEYDPAEYEPGDGDVVDTQNETTSYDEMLCSGELAEYVGTYIEVDSQDADNDMHVEQKVELSVVNPQKLKHTSSDVPPANTPGLESTENQDLSINIPNLLKRSAHGLADNVPKQQPAASLSSARIPRLKQASKMSFANVQNLKQSSGAVKFFSTEASDLNSLKNIGLPFELQKSESKSKIEDSEDEDLGLLVELNVQKENNLRQQEKVSSLEERCRVYEQELKTLRGQLKREIEEKNDFRERLSALTGGEIG